MNMISKSTNQQGAISLYVSIAIMLIIMIIGLSFAHIMSNSYTDTTKRQLNLEAQYAAETGIFDGRKIVKAYFQSLYNTEQSEEKKSPTRKREPGGHVPLDGEIKTFDGDDVAVAKLPNSYDQKIQFANPDQNQWNHCNEHGKLLDPGTTTDTEITVAWTSWSKAFDCKYPRYVLTILDPNQVISGTSPVKKGDVKTYIYDWTTKAWEDKGYLPSDCKTSPTFIPQQLSMFADNTDVYLGVMADNNNTSDKDTWVFVYELDATTLTWTMKIDEYVGNGVACDPFMGGFTPVFSHGGDRIHSFTIFKKGSNLAAIVTGYNDQSSSQTITHPARIIESNSEGTIWSTLGYIEMSLNVPAKTGVKMIPIDPTAGLTNGSKWLISIGDTVYTYTNGGYNWSWSPHNSQQFSGESSGLSIANSGNYVVVGAEDSDIKDDDTNGGASLKTGAVYQYTLSGNTLYPGEDTNGNDNLDTEDTNANCILDPGEDTNNNSKLDTEDKNCNGKLDSASFGINYLRANDPPDLQTGDKFGKSVSLAKNVLAVVAEKPGGDKVYVFGPQKIPPPKGVAATPLGVNRQLVKIPPCINHPSDIAGLMYIPDGQVTPTQVPLNLSLDGDRVGYSCLDIEIDPDVLYWEQVSNSKSLNVILKPIVYEDDDPNIEADKIREDADAPRMKKLKIKWTYTDENITKNPSRSWSPSAGYPNLPAENNWDAKAPLLRVMITPFDADGFSREELLQYTKTYYFYPGADNGQPPICYDKPKSTTCTKLKIPNIPEDESGYISEARCSNGKGGCVGVIKNLPHWIDDDVIDKIGDNTPGNENKEDDIQFLVSISSFYGDADVELKGFRGRALEEAIWDENTQDISGGARGDPDIRNDDPITGKRLKFRDIQAIIRATGYSTDIKVRLEERIPLQHPFFGTPYNTVNSATSLCKVLVGDPDVGTTTAGTINGGTSLTNADNRHKYFFDTDILVNALSPGDPADVFDRCHAWPTSP